MRTAQPAWMRVPGTIWTIAELKSAFHKSVRRRDPRAYQIARLVWSNGGAAGRSSLLRRFITIAAEEGTFDVVPEAGALLRRYHGERTRSTVTLEEVLRAIGRMMASARDKDPMYLQDWPGPVDARWPAERTAVMLWSQWSVKRGLRFLALAREAARGERVRDVLAALHARGRMGMVEGDLKIFCAIALLEREARGEPAILAAVEPSAIPEAEELTDLPWWCFDPHVALGKRALAAVLAKHPDVPVRDAAGDATAVWQRAFIIWFRSVSDQVDGYVEREGWRARRFARDLSAADIAWWREAAHTARAAIEESLCRRTLAAGLRPESRAVSAVVDR